jgi:hypothetical protein
VRRPVLLAALLGVLSVVLRRRSKAGQADKGRLDRGDDGTRPA